MTIGEQIRMIRTERCLSQRQVASLSHIDHAYLGRIENGGRLAAIETLDSIAEALDCELVIEFRPVRHYD